MVNNLLSLFNNYNYLFIAKSCLETILNLSSYTHAQAPRHTSALIIHKVIYRQQQDLKRRKIAARNGKRGRSVVLEKEMSWGWIRRTFPSPSIPPVSPGPTHTHTHTQSPYTHTHTRTTSVHTQSPYTHSHTHK